MGGLQRTGSGRGILTSADALEAPNSPSGALAIWMPNGNPRKATILCLSSRRQNRSATPPRRQNWRGLRLGETAHSVRQGLLWMAVLSTMLGSVCPWANAQDPSVVGQFSALMSWPGNATHAVLLPNGKVLWWLSFANGGKPQIFDPVSNTNALAIAPGYNIFCGGHSVLGNGRVLITGGDSSLNTGMANASLYDPVTGTWTFLPNMNAGRWYPTNTVLPNGDVVVISGEISPTLGVNPLPQVGRLQAIVILTLEPEHLKNRLATTRRIWRRWKGLFTETLKRLAIPVFLRRSFLPSSTKSA